MENDEAKKTVKYDPSTIPWDGSKKNNPTPVDRMIMKLKSVGQLKSVKKGK